MGVGRMKFRRADRVYDYRLRNIVSSKVVRRGIFAILSRPSEINVLLWCTETDIVLEFFLIS